MPIIKEKHPQDSPGGPVVKNPSCNAGDTGSNLVQGDPTCLGKLSLCATTIEAYVPRACALQGSMSPQ